MKVGILGSGFMGRTHARAYAKIDGVEVAAVSSLHLDKAQKLGNEIGGRATTGNTAIIKNPSSRPPTHTLPQRLPAEDTLTPRTPATPLLLVEALLLLVAVC